MSVLLNLPIHFLIEHNVNIFFMSGLATVQNDELNCSVLVGLWPNICPGMTASAFKL